MTTLMPSGSYITNRNYGLSKVKGLIEDSDQPFAMKDIKGLEQHSGKNAIEAAANVFSDDYQGPFMHTNSYYVTKDPKFKDITHVDLSMIYKGISDTIEKYGQEFQTRFNVIYRLELSPPADRADDPNYVKYVTVDLKNSRILLGRVSDGNDMEIVPKAESMFITSEEDFVRLYYGGVDTAVKAVLTGKLKLKGSYRLMLKAYDFQKFVGSDDQQLN